jgi:hypothetical protein
MITLAIAGGVLIMFSVLFYLEDRAGIGTYDPNSIHKKK